jgi:hypothetical protein
MAYPSSFFPGVPVNSMNSWLLSSPPGGLMNTSLIYTTPRAWGASNVKSNRPAVIRFMVDDLPGPALRGAARFLVLENGGDYLRTL